MSRPSYGELPTFEFTAEVIEWRGPAPHYWVALSEDDSDELVERPELSYGWGCVPANVTIGQTEYYTALMPKDGRYLVGLKAAVRRAEDIELGDEIHVVVDIIPPR